MNLDQNKNFFICMTCIVGTLALTCYVFAASRYDPNLRVAALTFATGIGGALVGIAGTLLTGKDPFASKGSTPELPDLPPMVGSASTTVTATTTARKE